MTEPRRHATIQCDCGSAFRAFRSTAKRCPRCKALVSALRLRQYTSKCARAACGSDYYRLDRGKRGSHCIECVELGIGKRPPRMAQACAICGKDAQPAPYRAPDLERGETYAAPKVCARCIDNADRAHAAETTELLIEALGGEQRARAPKPKTKQKPAKRAPESEPDEYSYRRPSEEERAEAERRTQEVIAAREAKRAELERQQHASADQRRHEAAEAKRLEVEQRKQEAAVQAEFRRQEAEQAEFQRFMDADHRTAEQRGVRPGLASSAYDRFLDARKTDPTLTAEHWLLTESDTSTANSDTDGGNTP